ncbi:hypothetical protein [Luteibacter yeojuensis]|uniref:Uncharacterized protein n=1 Tax=Luteibacter yeojuensis TaxID=345309 RepID=A0A7X5QU25_9GAMM|nr:hypothetical protein [Luteibacter yeojuensis]NID15430.1 hypothetical protein [Luteibacter yeojuensis]
MSTELKAFQCDETELFAAVSAEQAAELYEDWTGEAPEAPYPAELTDAQLDEPIPDFDEDENPTGEMTSVRQFLAEHGDEPGWLAGSMG